MCRHVCVPAYMDVLKSACAHTCVCVCVCVCVMEREGLGGVQTSWQDLDTQSHEKQPLLLPVSPQATSAQPQAHGAQGSPLEFLFPSD